MTTPANTRAVDVTGMDARMDAIRLKQILGGALTGQELMCLQIEQNGFGCGTCSSPAYLVDARTEPRPPAVSAGAAAGPPPPPRVLMVAPGGFRGGSPPPASATTAPAAPAASSA